MPFFHGARDVKISNSIFNDIAGNWYKFSSQTTQSTPVAHLHELSAPGAIYNLRPSGLYPDTGVATMQSLEHWLAERNVPILLLRGPAGSGKSTIAREFVSSSAQADIFPVISFSFARDDPQCSNLNCVPPTLAIQLHTMEHPGLKETIEGTLGADPLIWSRSLSKQFKEFVLKPIRESIATSPRTNRTFIIFLDNIDACQDHNALRRFLSDLKATIAKESHYNRIKILCTSRDVSPIDVAFRPLIRYYRHVSIQSQDARKDILTYLKGSAQDLMQSNLQWPWDAMFNHIADVAADNFGIAAGTLQKLRDSNIQHPEDIQQVTGVVSAQFSATTNVDAQPNQEEPRRPNDVGALTILLDILRRKDLQAPMGEVVTSGTIEFMTELLSQNDYVTIPSQLGGNVQDALNLLEFLIYLLDSESLPHEGNRRARRLMIKLGKMANSIPKSLFLNAADITMNQNWPVAYGGFAVIFKGKFRGNPVALKRINSRAMDQVFVRETLTWRTLHHNNVLPFLGIYQNPAGPGITCLVSPFMEHGTLSEWRSANNPGVLDVENRIFQVAEGLQYLHREGVIHCDIHGSNVLLDHDYHVRIADFGLTRDSDATATTNRSKSFRFAAPELFGSDGTEDDDRLKRTEKTDVYAFGCLYYEIYFDCLPFAKGDYTFVIGRVTHGHRPQRRSDPPLRDEAWKLIEKCWDQDPGKRPSMDDVVETMISP